MKSFLREAPPPLQGTPRRGVCRFPEETSRRTRKKTSEKQAFLKKGQLPGGNLGIEIPRVLQCFPNCRMRRTLGFAAFSAAFTAFSHYAGGKHFTSASLAFEKELGKNSVFEKRAASWRKLFSVGIEIPRVLQCFRKLPGETFSAWASKFLEFYSVFQTIACTKRVVLLHFP